MRVIRKWVLISGIRKLRRPHVISIHSRMCESVNGAGSVKHYRSLLGHESEMVVTDAAAEAAQQKKKEAEEAQKRMRGVLSRGKMRSVSEEDEGEDRGEGMGGEEGEEGGGGGGGGCAATTSSSSDDKETGNVMHLCMCVHMHDV